MNESTADPDATLVCELYGSLRRFAAIVAPAAVEPDDLVQEALARTLRTQRLVDLDDASRYLRRVMVNLVTNVYRQSHRHRRALTRLGRTTDATAPTYPSDLWMLATLDPDVRAVLYLAEIEGCPYGEIGDLLGCSEEAARTRAFRGRRELRSLMENDDD